MIITKEEFEKNSHISDEQIKLDISKTQKDVDDLNLFLDNIKKKGSDSVYKFAKAKVNDMTEERELFISLLSQILEYRKNKLEDLQ